ncbi:MAG: hypothetical protein AAGU75_10680, partial [Bacillota bacterium]
MGYVVNAFKLNQSAYALITDEFNEEIRSAEFSFVEKLIKDNIFGVGIYCAPDFRLLKANQKYSDYLKAKYHLKSIPLGQCMQDFVPEFKGSILESVWINTAATGETSYL